MSRRWVVGGILFGLAVLVLLLAARVEPERAVLEPLPEPSATAAAGPVPPPTPTPTSVPSATGDAAGTPEGLPGAAPQPAATPEPTATAVLPTATPVPPQEPVAYAPGAAAALEPGGPLDGLRIGLIANQASVVDGVSTIDLFAASDRFELAAIFAPEHGPRGELAAGEQVPDGVDPATGVVVHSLYGSTRAPTPEMLAGLDAVVFDLQGVGARFYTFDSTMGLAMQSAAAADLPFFVLDRPYPLGYVVATGFMLDPGFESFIGQYPVPAMHAMTSGELALAIVGEGWLPGLDGLDLTVVPVQGWRYGDAWSSLGVDWVPPSPGLPTYESAELYPAAVWFEATTLSYGRGTDLVFRQIGAPWIDPDALGEALAGLSEAGVGFEPVSFVPDDGAHAGTEVHGVRLQVTEPTRYEPFAAATVLLTAVISHGQERGIPIEQVIDRPDFLDLLAGTDRFRRGLERGASAWDLIELYGVEPGPFEEAMYDYRLYGGR